MHREFSSSCLWCDVIQRVNAHTVFVHLKVQVGSFRIAGITHLTDLLTVADLLTGLYCAAPAGASEMALIASDVGADGPNVAILQISRMLGVIAFFPTIFTMILKIFA